MKKSLNFFRKISRVVRNIRYIWNVKQELTELKDRLDEMELRAAAFNVLLVNMRYELISDVEKPTSCFNN